MPFDGSNLDFALDRMDHVIAMLSSPDHWCKDAESTSDGRRCIIGALRAAGAQELLQPVILKSIAEVTGQYRSVQGFNDSSTTDHALILTVLRHARRRVASGGTIPAVEARRLRSAAWRYLRRNG